MIVGPSVARENYHIHVANRKFLREIFEGLNFLQIGNLYHFIGLIFADEHTHTHYALFS